MDLSYPIGKPEWPTSVSPADRPRLIAEIGSAPELFRSAVARLNDRQLDTPYRPEGWTVRQVIHHLADSHMNAFLRFRWALTEENPAIKPYDEKTWAELPDARNEPVEMSLTLLDGLHKRWAATLRGMSDGDFKRTYQHPERGSMPLDATLALYVWHCRHHAAHVTRLRERMNW
jgi:uncharacterized damage-inducible protein DinB